MAASTDSQIIFISVGQAGVQSAHAAWELFALEHGVGLDGEIAADYDMSNDPERTNVLFYEVENGARVPRAIMVDLEPTVVDEIRSGSYRDFFHPDGLVTGYEDASSNFARGRISKGRTILDTTLNQVRKEAARCDSLQGFIINSGLGGGTGSGFTTLLIECLGVEFGKNCKLMVNIMPGPIMATAVVEPYNVVLSMDSCIQMTDVNVTFDNQAMYQTCRDRLRLDRPTYNNLNRLTAQVQSSMTCSLRYRSLINSDLNQLQTNIVPYPRIHFPIVSYAPLATIMLQNHELFNAKQAVGDLFDNNGRLVSCNCEDGKYMACSLQFRGRVSAREANNAVNHIKALKQLRFVDWCPTGFKLGICTRPPISVPGSGIVESSMNCAMICNNTAISSLWHNLRTKYSMLFSKKAFVHWYVGEGLEESEMTDSLAYLDDLIQDYNQVAEDDDEEAEADEPQEQPEGERQEEKLQSSPGSVENVDIPGNPGEPEEQDGEPLRGTDSRQASNPGEPEEEQEFQEGERQSDMPAAEAEAEEEDEMGEEM